MNFAKALQSIAKSNPYHDKDGEFTTKDKAVHSGASVRASMKIRDPMLSGASNPVHYGGKAVGYVGKVIGQDGKTVWSGTHPASDLVLGLHKTQGLAADELAAKHAEHLNGGAAKIGTTPDKVESWVKMGGQKGSNPGGTYETGGKKYYVKFPN